MKAASGAIQLLFVLFFTPHATGTHYSPPGKPTLTRCRSPEKETFTCWWEPGSDGGLPTTYALYYRKENSDTVHECPDYHTAGENSCFFNKNDTSIWINYNITVVATNKLGSAFSDPVDIDVVYIVKPNPPEKVTVTVMDEKSLPFLRVSWEPPHKADTRSGWITLIYELRVKLEGVEEWEMHLAGQQKMFNIFSLRSGGAYVIQVRCKPDHGFWSEWSSPFQIRVPDYFQPEKAVWVLITVFAAFIFLIFTWLLHMNSNSLKHYILPPVPGPKIRGFDKQLLKDGKSEDLFSALVVSGFPPTSSSDYEDLLVEYLEVYVSKDQEQAEGKLLINGCLKCESATSDSDSGRGSCDSHTLLMDKCGQTGRERAGVESHKSWEEGPLAYADVEMVSPDVSSSRVKTWPSVFSPVPQYSCNLLEQQQQRSLEPAKQHYLSDSLFLPGSYPSYLSQPGSGSKEAQLLPSYWEFSSSSRQPHLLHPHAQACRQLQAHSDVDISSIGRYEAAAVALSPPAAQEEELVTLRKMGSGPGMPHGDDYSKVKGVEKDNVLLLQREGTEDSHSHWQEEGGVKDHRCASSAATKKPGAYIHSSAAALGEAIHAANGYVDTAALPSY